MSDPKCPDCGGTCGKRPDDLELYGCNCGATLDCLRAQLAAKDAQIARLTGERERLASVVLDRDIAECLQEYVEIAEILHGESGWDAGDVRSKVIELQERHEKNRDEAWAAHEVVRERELERNAARAERDDAIARWSAAERQCRNWHCEAGDCPTTIADVGYAAPNSAAWVPGVGYRCAAHTGASR